MKKCKNCRTEYSDAETKCPNCGSPYIETAEDIAKEEEFRKKEEENYRKFNRIRRVDRRKIAIAILVAICLLIAFVVFSLISEHNKIKELYSTGTSYYENNQIEEAIEVLNQIPSRSGYYDDAQDLLAKAAVEYCDDVITQSDEYLKNKDYVSSIECLRHALGLLPNDEKLKSAFSSANDQYTSYSLELANGKAKDSKLAEAIGILETALEWVDNDEINSQLNTYRNTYRENIIKKARKKLNTDGYSSAMKILTKALNVLGSDDKLQETIDLFKTYQPVELSDMEPYEITDHVRVGGYEDIEKDNYGKQYPSESIISSYSSLICEEEGKGSVKYYLGKEYSVLEGTIYVPYDARNITKNSDKINEKYGMTKIKIYGDDKLIYEAKQINGSAKPYNFTANIKGVEFLTIQTYGGWIEHAMSVGVRSMNPTMCIANLGVAKR